jgi:ribose transport system permease protein
LPRLRGDLQSWGPLAALVVLCVAFSVASPRFATIENFQNVADAAVLLMVVATGLTFVLLTGAIDLSVEGVMAVSALVVAILVANNRNGLGLGLLGVAIAVGVGAGFGMLNGIINTRLRVPSFMATLGMSSIGIGVATILYSGSAPVITDEWFSSWALEKWFGFSRLTYVAIGVVVIGYLIQRYTRVGRYAYVIGGGEDVAALSGIKVARFKVLIFTLAGAAFGLAGVMSAARLGAGVVQAGTGLQFAGITAVVIGGTLLSGGRGGILHTVVGVMIITVLSDGMILIGVSPYVQKALQGVLIVAAIVITGWPLRRRMRVIK